MKKKYTLRVFVVVLYNVHLTLRDVLEVSDLVISVTKGHRKRARQGVDKDKTTIKMSVKENKAYKRISSNTIGVR